MRKSINEKYILLLSHLTRGAWIEIGVAVKPFPIPVRRTSHEVRGLKYKRAYDYDRHKKSHLTRGAWIEIGNIESGNTSFESHLTRGAWIEIHRLLL